MKPKFRTLLASSVLLSISYAQAATYTWTNLDNATPVTNGNWSGGESWSGVPVSAADTTLVFGYSFGINSTAETNTLTNNIANPFLLNVLTLGINTPSAGNGSNVALINIAGSPLEFVSNGATTPQVNLNQNRSGGQVVSFNVQSNVILTNNTLFTGNGTANFTVSGGISGGGTLTKSGSSALTLSGAISSTGGLVMNAGTLTLSNASNSYIGGTSINGGTLSVSSTGTLGSNVNTNNVSIAAGARLDLSAAGNTGANQTITLTSTAGSLATLALGYNGVPNAAIAQFDTNGGLIALNGITGFTGNLTTALTGKNLFLGSIGTSTFTGGAATLAAGNGSTYRLGGGGGTISFNTANQITGANSVQIGSTATGGTGTVIFGAAQNYSLGTTITAGSTLRFDTLTSMPAAGTVTVADGATLGVTVNTGIWGGGTGVAGIAGLTSTANGGEGFGGQSGAVVNFDGNSRLLLNVTGNVSEANTITNGSATSIALIKSGASTLTLSGNNSYSGGTTLSQGVLAIGHNSALGAGTLTINGGTTIQSDNTTARTLSNAVTIGGDFTVGGTGNLTFSNTGASALGAIRTITVNTGINATFAQAFSGAGAGITKAGAGTLTLIGNNSFTGITTINAGSIVLNNDGDVTGSVGVLFNASNTSLTVTGGSGVTSTWNAGGGNITTTSGPVSNVQMLIDGAGTAGSARVTNVNILAWGRTSQNSTLTLTNGGQMNVNGEIRTGNPYYGTTGNTDIVIGGGTATSTFTGNNQAFYIGYGERNASKDNDVTINSGGVLTGIGNMFVGHVNYGVVLGTSTNNKLTVDGTGTASMVSVTVGYAQVATDAANANVVQVTGGGTLTTSGTSYVGRTANVAGVSNTNTLTVTGTGSTWNAGNQTVNVGFTGTTAGANSNNNILTVSSGGSLTNVSSLIVGSGSGTETGNKVVIDGGSLTTASGVTVNASNTLEFGTSGGTLNGSIVNNGALTIGSNVAVSLAGNISGSTGSITQTGAGTTTLSGTNSYTGTTAVNAGTLQFAKMVSLNNNVDTNWIAAKINVKSGATLALNVDSAGTNGFTDVKINTLLTNISVANTASEGLQAGAILGFDTSTATGGTFTQGNAIADSTGGSGGAIGVSKLGAGTLVLDQINTYTGATLVSAGTLFVTGSLTSNVTVSNGAILGGGGNVGDISFGGGSFFDIALAVGGTPDSLTSGAISFAAAGFGVDNLVFNGLAVNWGDVAVGTHTLITGTLNSSNLDHFGLANAYDIGGGRSAYFQSGSLQLVVIPEPNAAALLGALGTLMLLRRRR